MIKHTFCISELGDMIEIVPLLGQYNKPYVNIVNGLD